MKPIIRLIGLLCIITIGGYSYAQTISTPSVPVIDIEANIRNMKKMYLSQFTDNVRYIPLETNIEHLIESIISLDISDKYILASTMTVCYLYDSRGHFIRSIGKQGRGPGEYTFIEAVYLMNDKIYIICEPDMIEYKINGEFVKRYKNTYRVNGTFRLDDLFIINDSVLFGHHVNFSGMEPYKAFLLDKNGNAKNYYKNYTLFKLNSGAHFADFGTEKASINKFRNRTFYLDPMDDTLFRLDSRNKLIPEYVFRLGKYKESISERAKGPEGLGYTSTVHILKVFQTENYLFFDCFFGNRFPAKRLTPNKLEPMPQYNLDFFTWYNMTNALGIYNRKTSGLVFSEPTSTDNYYFTTGFYNDIDGGPRFMPGRMVNDSTMLMILYFPRLKAHIASNDFENSKPKYPEKKRRLEVLTDSLTKTEIDNPVLMLVTFKK